MNKPLILLLTVQFTAIVACGGQSDPAPVPARQAPATSESGAAASAKPGSYEDWCAEHEVPESLCTACNPTLVAAFKAPGDWCAEHGLPESQCRACNPALKIERPARAGGE